MLEKLKNIGPGIIVTSAFIGPGTVTLCILSGINFGYSLIWCIVFSIFATCYLQELSSRLGIISKKGLTEALSELQNPLIKKIALSFVFLSLFVGNSAYESGNISGTTMGLETFTGSLSFSLAEFSINILPILIGSILILLIKMGSYKTFERVLILLVSLMSFTFILLAIISKPKLSDLLNGLNPSITNTNFIYVIGLIGTTVVPYNLFLHSYIVKNKWKDKEDYKKSLFDTILSIVIGGIISLSIIIVSASMSSNGEAENINNAVDLGAQLSPLLGDFAKYFISIGLFCAGVTSSITAPIATSYALSGIFKYEPKWEDRTFKKISYLIILVGIFFSSINYKPIVIIKLAQFINGLFLPLIAFFLLWAINNKKLMGSYVSSKSYNLIGIFIVIISLLISYRSLVLT